jgi:catalytic LigB subunit of aromatic ring-opening dioxygenase
MAEIVLGIGTSHSPTLSLKPEEVPAYAAGDRRNPQLLHPPEGTLMTYDELEAAADAHTREAGSKPDFEAEYRRYQKAIETLAQTFARLKPDVAILFGDDQEELFFDDNMPSLSIYWGETMPWLPQAYPPVPAAQPAAWGYGRQQMDYPVDSKLALHLIHWLMDADFDVAQSRYVNEESGGRVGPIGYISKPWDTPKRPYGMIHAYEFVCERIMEESRTPIVPITINTCYPPNQISPRRAYALGRAVRRAVEEWDKDIRVAVVGSGGLSHFVVDEDLDRLVLDLMKNRNAEGVAALPRERMNSATSEIRNWLAAAGATEHLEMEVVDYVPARRTPAGTGGGWGFARWL